MSSTCIWIRQLMNGSVWWKSLSSLLVQLLIPILDCWECAWAVCICIRLYGQLSYRFFLKIQLFTVHLFCRPSSYTSNTGVLQKRSADGCTKRRYFCFVFGDVCSMLLGPLASPCKLQYLSYCILNLIFCFYQGQWFTQVAFYAKWATRWCWVGLLCQRTGVLIFSLNIFCHLVLMGWFALDFYSFPWLMCVSEITWRLQTGKRDSLWLLWYRGTII